MEEERESSQDEKRKKQERRGGCAGGGLVAGSQWRYGYSEGIARDAEIRLHAVCAAGSVMCTDVSRSILLQWRGFWNFIF